MAPAAVVSELAPAGKLRAAINFGNPILASKDPATGEARRPRAGAPWHRGRSGGAAGKARFLFRCGGSLPPLRPVSWELRS